MANINYEALKEQLLAQGIALPELNFCVVNESNQNSQDSTRENFGAETTPPVAMTECQVRNEESFEFGQSLEGELIELMKDYRCVWDVSCRAFKENQKKQQAWKEIAMKLNKDGEPYSIAFYASLYLYRNFSQFTFILHSKSTQRNPCWCSGN